MFLQVLERSGQIMCYHQLKDCHSLKCCRIISLGVQKKVYSVAFFSIRRLAKTCRLGSYLTQQFKRTRGHAVKKGTLDANL